MSTWCSRGRSYGDEMQASICGMSSRKSHHNKCLISPPGGGNYVCGCVMKGQFRRLAGLIIITYSICTFRRKRSNIE